MGAIDKDGYKLLNLRVLKILAYVSNAHLSMYGQYILCEISQGTYEIPHILEGYKGFHHKSSEQLVIMTIFVQVLQFILQ